jgi:hypothetical protein
VVDWTPKEKHGRIDGSTEALTKEDGKWGLMIPAKPGAVEIVLR